MISNIFKYTYVYTFPDFLRTQRQCNIDGEEGGNMGSRIKQSYHQTLFQPTY